MIADCLAIAGAILIAPCLGVFLLEIAVGILRKRVTLCEACEKRPALIGAKCSYCSHHQA